MFRSVKKILHNENITAGVFLNEKSDWLFSTDFIGFAVVTPYGLIGWIEDYLIDADTGEVGFLVIDTQGIFPERNLLMPAETITQIDRERKLFHADTSIHEIRNDSDS
jgi:uncharacterized protein YrrD